MKISSRRWKLEEGRVFDWRLHRQFTLHSFRCIFSCHSKMRFIRIILLLAITWSPLALCDVQASVLRTLDHIKPSASVETQKAAAEGVISRLLPSHQAALFQVAIREDLPQNTFQLVKEEGDTVVQIRASDGVSACKGFHHYLKYYLNCHVSWSGSQLSNFPEELPSIEKQMTSSSRFIYHQNVCTWSYSFAWWTWRDWQRHIDWMAMMGISLTIAPIQEAIWTRIYRNLGMTDGEIDDHFAGPAFQAWQRMANIRGWGGPLPAFYKDQQLSLQKKILQAQRDLGMTVAVPAFAGHVPVAFRRIFPNTTLTPVSIWNRFPEKYCSPLSVDPNDPLFHTIGEAFLKEVVQEYGTDHVYFSDPFNEITPHVSDPTYIARTSASIYHSLSSVDPEAIWLLQGWFLLNPFWRQDLKKSFLTAVPVGRMLVLDLMSEQSPQYEMTHSYYGQPFIWCMLHNFGGTLGMHGSVQIVNERISLTRNMTNSTMVGVGITPEGINQNYVLYEFALERGWVAKEFDLDEWFDQFLATRYGQIDDKIEEAWQYIRKSVYAYHGLIKLHGKYTVARRPSTKLSPWTWYDPGHVKAAWAGMLNCTRGIRSSPLYQHDLVDITRQYLQNMGDHVYVNIMSAYRAKNETLLDELSLMMIELLTDMENVLRTNAHFLLGNWLQAAKELSTDPRERFLFEINARNQITTWGPTGQIVDYATKQWSGIVSDFFLPRWKLFLTDLKTSLQQNSSFNENKFKRKVFKRVENPFNVATKVYPTTPRGNSVAVSWEIFRKWDVFEQSGLLLEPLSSNIEDLAIEVTPNVIFS